jgi:hypothetical protein
MKINVFHCRILLPMETVYSMEGDNHPYESQAFAIHPDARKIIE